MSVLKFFKKIGIIAIVLFSFYYTDQISNLVLESNPLYKDIVKNKDDFEVMSTSAIINDEYITPGLNGLSIDVKNSYYNMKTLETFNSYYLVYEESTPEVSIENNKDKIIKKGNSSKNSIALVVEYNEKIIDYLKNKKISVLTNLNNFDKSATYEQINDDYTNYTKLENLINKYVKNPKICLVNENNKSQCIANKAFLVEPSKILNDNTVLNLKDNIESGDIILIKKNTKLENIDIILKSIEYKDYNLNYLSDHISEKRS